MCNKVKLKGGNLMCDNEQLDEYASWIDEASSKDELLDILYDIRDDLTGENDEDDGGIQYTIKK